MDEFKIRPDWSKDCGVLIGSSSLLQVARLTIKTLDEIEFQFTRPLRRSSVSGLFTNYPSWRTRGSHYATKPVYL